MQPIPIIVAHRGLHWEEIPENSLNAFDLAMEEGFHWAECDVQPTDDNEPVILHDDTLDRTTTFSGPVRNILWSKLQDCRLRNPITSQPTTEPLPSCASCEALPTYGHLLIEIKPPDNAALVSKVVEILQALPGDRWMIQSFDESNLRHAVATGTKIPLGFLIDQPQILDAAIDGPWPAILMDHPLLNQNVVDRLRRNGKKIGVWTVNKKPDIKRVIALHPDMIITDQPDIVAQMIHQAAGA